ncbi:MAG TPA: PAS domain S-box protein, partial [Candidatus Sulfomarinibacteraceae bacterium]|nr:PAS domain S-box protein [Candidatus Sulfomarinibacteraceae bacterium]
MAPLRDSDAQSHSPFPESDRVPGAAIEYQRIFEAINDGLIIHDAETGLVVEANPAASALHGYARENFVGLHPTTFMDTDSYAHFSDWLQSLRAGDTFEATAVHVRRNGTLFTAEVRGTGCLLGDRLCLVSVIRDVSARVQAERMLRQQVAARLREQSTLLEISQKLASALELNPGLILDQLRMIVAYTRAVLFTLQELDLVALAVRGPQQLKEATPYRIPLEGPETLPALLNGHRVQRIADVWSDEPAAQGLRSLLSDHGAIL